MADEDQATVQDDTEHTDAQETDAEQTEDESDDEQTFPAEVVRKLRKEAHGLRERAKTAEDRAEELGKRLHLELVRATGKLADPSDLAFDAEHLDDADTLTAAIDSLTASKPHLRSRTPRGEVGQGVTGEQNTEVDLLGMLRQRA